MLPVLNDVFYVREEPNDYRTHIAGFLTLGRFTQGQNYRRLGAPSVTNVTLEQGDALDSQL